MNQHRLVVDRKASSGTSTPTPTLLRRSVFRTCCSASFQRCVGKRVPSDTMTVSTHLLRPSRISQRRWRSPLTSKSSYERWRSGLTFKRRLLMTPSRDKPRGAWDVTRSTSSSSPRSWWRRYLYMGMSICLRTIKVFLSLS